MNAFRYKTFLVIARILMAYFSPGESQENDSREMCSSTECSCFSESSKGQHYEIAASCKLQSIGDLKNVIQEPRNVTTLSLKVDAFYTIPPLKFVDFTNLVNLTLSDNRVAVITKNAFQGLNRLQFLNLSGNKIRFWEGEGLSSQLPLLRRIEMAGNPRWTPTDELLRIQGLQELKGITWSDECAECSLVKNESSPLTKLYSQGSYSDYIVWHCRGTEYTVSKKTRNFARFQFLPECFDYNEKCYQAEVKATMNHRCWDTDNRILYIEYVLGIIVIVLNVTVVTVTLTSSLKTNVAMLLVSNLAVSDFLNGVYSISITLARQSAPYTEFVTFLDRLCPVLGFLWVLGQFSTIQTSLLLTIERYTTIVFSMRPHLKPTPGVAFIGIAFSWVIALVAAILPLVGLGSYVTNTYCVPMQPSKEVPSTFLYSLGMSLLGVILYFTTIPLYVRIFAFVRKSSHQVGIKRDGKIARRISILVLSNMIFFLTPIIIALLWLLTDIFKKNISVQARNILVGVFPTVCFSLNSFLNPLLYAFRNNRFRHALLIKLRKIVITPNSSVGDISMKSRTESKMNN
ncbi:follicle-stimulating hormone receptor-like isoform X2 [Actinia tenebrosa]|nr:follicle-stimulating hormone receptor-like isoform X2 [Actinia tenebrosa]XP_031554654.1 follicle-stimulating hormone receptor-like isoform X2 [Actinia tenebrosa]XP_031554655.1 follicle-stimulating hormone receptor-like isoform X2 [Actinia tenebrosa]